MPFPLLNPNLLPDSNVYGKGMQDVLTQSMGAKTQSLGTIQDIINQWQQTAQSFT